MYITNDFLYSLQFTRTRKSVYKYNKKLMDLLKDPNFLKILKNMMNKSVSSKFYSASILIFYFIIFETLTNF